MAVKKITYTDIPEGVDVLKENIIPVVNRETQSTAEDFNEIAKVVNNNADLLDENIDLATQNAEDIEVIQNTMVTQNMINTNIPLYATDSVDSLGFLIMVTSQDNEDYNTEPVAIPTDEVTANNQMILELITEYSLLNGSAESITVNSTAVLSKISGNANQYCSFYFKVFKIDIEEVETLLGTSSPTEVVNPEDTEYHNYLSSVVIKFNEISNTDKLIIRYYSTAMNQAGAYYQFQFGGENPTRIDVTVPMTVVATNADQVNVDASEFSGILSESDNKLDMALRTIDEHNHYHDQLRGIDSGLLKHMTLTQEAALSDYVAKTVKFKSPSLTSGTTLLAEIPISSGYGAIITYAILTTTDSVLRVGQKYVGWNGSNVNSTDTSTVDIGDSTETFDFDFEINGTNVEFSAVVTSGVFVVKCEIKLL